MVRISHLTLLIHQFKISRQIDLYYYAPRQVHDETNLEESHNLGQQLLSTNGNLNFTRVGHFSLDDNVKTNYKARELKTVYVECTCQYLKIVFSKNHPNNMNIFNQVGLVSLKVFGSQMGAYESSLLSGVPIKNQQPYSLDNSIKLGPEFVPRNLKMQTVDIQNFDKMIYDKIMKL